MKPVLVPLRPLAAALSLSMLCGTAAHADTNMAEAMEHYRNGHVSAAYGRFAELADRGDAEAARIALMMLRYGPQLYGHEWGASQPQIERWTELAIQRVEKLMARSGD